MQRSNSVKTFPNVWKTLKEDESGQDLIEYALVAGLIGLVAVASLQLLAGSITKIFTNLKTSLDTAAGT
jgi:pilus assembly protein Flp/PilA